MSLNQYVATGQRFRANIQLGAWSGFTPPALYSDVLEATPVTISPPEQETKRNIGVSVKNAGIVLGAGANPTGTPSRLVFTTKTAHPLLRAIQLGADLTEYTQSAVQAGVESITLALAGWSPIPAWKIAAHSESTPFVVGVASTADTGVVGNNNAIAWRSIVPGATPSITIVDPATPSQSLAVTVSGSDVSVSLATDGAGAESSTAAEVIAAVAAHASASLLIAGANKTTSTGAGICAAASKTTLSGGSVLASTKYETDLIAGKIRAVHADAVGAFAASFFTRSHAAAQYAAGQVRSSYFHIDATVYDQQKDDWGKLDVWRVLLSSTEVFDPTTGEYIETKVEGDLELPKDANGNWIVIQGRTPSSPWNLIEP